MILTTKTTERWAPNWEGNLELPEAERVYVTMRFPDAEERARIRTIRGSYVMPKDKETRDSADAMEIRIDARYDVPYVMRKLVKKIENLTDNVDGREVQLDTGEKVLASANRKLTALIDKILAKLDEDEISEADEKNFEQPSTS